ncbi:unnamed protein product [Litomosoides sigmodontis]|uniref:Condensin complex subunit 1 C-terminal domain-containing protein n=1 Tax=Litomosoides sigmodontis TaxID=42156 RepID=A0A3P6UFI7_LITSI|nr:unnamed protein product [Litomosoides sigmodontis]
MGKKGRCKNPKRNEKCEEKKESEMTLFGSSDSDEKPTSVDRSQYSAKAVNCMKCLKPKDERPYSREPAIKEIMDVFGEKPVAENFKRALQLIDELVDNYDISEKIAEMIHYGMEVILIQGMQFTDPTIQYYSIHALSVIAKHMNETQLKNLMPCGLLRGFAAALQSDTYFIIQEAIEACSSIVVRSAAMRDILAAFGFLHISELLSMYYEVISTEFASVIATFLRDLCHLAPVPEFILKRVANSARHLLQHEDYKIRSAALVAVLEVVNNKDFIVTFEGAYMELIVKFLDSPRHSEIKPAFDIVAEFTKQCSCNTDELMKAKFIGKLMSVLMQNSTPDFGYDACSILARILSRKKHVESVMDSGLVLLLIGLMDEGTSFYKIKACKALTCMCSNIDRRSAAKLADQVYLEKLCSILANDDGGCVACALALMNCMLKACEKGEGQLIQATKYIMESEAYEYIIQYVNSKCYKIQNLAESVYHQLCGNAREKVSRAINF